MAFIRELQTQIDEGYFSELSEDELSEDDNDFWEWEIEWEIENNDLSTFFYDWVIVSYHELWLPDRIQVITQDVTIQC